MLMSCTSISRLHGMNLTSVLLAICCPSDCTVVSGIVIVVSICNRSQMRTRKCTHSFFGVSISLDTDKKCTKGIFDRSKFKVTRDISPTISGWLLVDKAIKQQRTRLTACVEAKGGHFEHKL